MTPATLPLISLLEAVTPPGAFAAALCDNGQCLPLLPEEAGFVERAAAKRQREFVLGRACARAALAALGQGEAMLPRKEDGAPLWPDGIVGSISHTDGNAVALVAPANRFRGLGVDVERQGRVTPELYRHIFAAEERAWLESLAAPARDALAGLLFSAKEASCKVWLGLHGGSQPFTGILVTMMDQGFTARFPGRGYGPLSGRFARGEKLVLAAAWDAA